MDWTPRHLGEIPELNQEVLYEFTNCTVMGWGRNKTVSKNLF